MKCIEISVETDNEAAEAVSAMLSEYDGSGPVVEQVWQESGCPVVRVKLFLSTRQSEAVARIEEALWHMGQLHPISEPSVRWLDEADWMEAWKARYSLQHIGRRIVIRPSWQSYQSENGEVVIQLDPGMAFGTGLHPSTRLCLRALEDWMRPGDCVLDVGTGSGILAIAAAKLGARSVVAIDIDETALQVAAENASANDTQDLIHLEQASLLPASPQTESPWEGTADFLLMNILAKVVAASSERIAAHLAADGVFVVSGITQSQEEQVLQALAAAGLQIKERREEGDWVALIGGKEGRQGAKH